jgi:hypothetical protein
MIGDIAVGTAAMLAANKAQGGIDAVTGTANPAEHVECMHSDMHDIVEHLGRICKYIDSQSVGDVEKVIMLQVAPNFLRLYRHGRIHSYLFVSASTSVTFDMIGVGQFNYTLAQGWTQLDLPDGTGIAMATGGNPTSMFYRCSNNPMS